MKPGPELDALMAEKIMHGEVPAQFMPSKSIVDAWLVMDKLIADGWQCNILCHELDDNMCELWGGKKGDPFWREFVNHQASVPIAICLAALKTIE